jgi:hypothetical protein
MFKNSGWRRSKLVAAFWIRLQGAVHVVLFGAFLLLMFQARSAADGRLQRNGERVASASAEAAELAERLLSR